MKEKKILSTKLLSLQLKRAIFLAFKQAKKYGNNTVSSKFLLYGILKTDNNLVTNAITNLYSQQLPFTNKVEKILNKCELEFKNVSTRDIIDNNELTFSRPIRRLLFSISKSIKNEKPIVITTFQVFNLMIRNKSLRNWIKQALIDN